MLKYIPFIIVGSVMLLILVLSLYIVISDKVKRRRTAKAIITLQEEAKKQLESDGYIIIDCEVFANIDTTENLEIFYKVKDKGGQEHTFLAHLKDNNIGFEVIEDELYQFLWT